MQAIRIHRQGDPEVMQLEELAEPTPGPGQLRLRLHAAGVNPVDTYLRAGDQGYAVPLPWTPGLDGAGEVEAVGAGVDRFRPGDRVYCAGSLSGTYAQKALCTQDQVHPLPAHVGFAAGACLGVPYATAYRALFQRGGARAGETVLIHGASGGVGLAAVQLARRAGLRAIGTASGAQERELVRRQGADAVLNHADPAHFDAIPGLTNGQGVDLLLELAAHANLGRDLPVMARRGRVVVIGSRGTVELNPRDTMSRDLDIRGMSLFNTPAEEMQQIHAALGLWLGDGTLNPLVTVELPLTQAGEAHQRVLQHHTGKIVLTI